MIKITSASEVITVDNICMTIYSQPGLGKTSLSFTSSRPLLFDFDKGAYRAVDRKDVVQVSKWADVANVQASDLEPFDTIIIDTVGKALDFLAADIIEKSSRYAYGGALNQQGWGQLGVRFQAFLKMLKSFGKDVVLIAHMDEQRDGDVTRERLKIQGGTKDLVLTDSDVIGRISIYNKERHLVFSPTEASLGKDPTQVNSAVIPLSSEKAFGTFLSDTIQGIKDGLNELSEAQVERKSELEWFKAHLPEIKDADGINNVLSRAKKSGRDVAKMVVDRAKELGLEYDAESRGYVYLEETGVSQPELTAAPNDDLGGDEIPTFEPAGPDVGDGENGAGGVV